MLEQLREDILDDLLKLNSRMSGDVQERRTYLTDLLEGTSMGKPSFPRSYSVRTRVAYYNKDIKSDFKLNNSNFDKEELTKEARRQIYHAKKRKAAEIREGLNKMDKLLNLQFETNEQFKKASPEQHCMIIADHKSDRKSYTRRMEYELRQELDAIRHLPCSRVYVHKRQDYRSEDNIRETMRESIVRIQRVESEKTAYNLRYPDATPQQRALAHENIERKEAKCRITERWKATLRDIADRAKYLEEHGKIDIPTRDKMLEEYHRLVATQPPQKFPSKWTDCVMALVQDRESYASWNEFVPCAASRWLTLNLAEKQEKKPIWDKIIHDYATVSMMRDDDTSIPGLVPFHSRLQQLRDERDNLLNTLLDLDQSIKNSRYRVNMNNRCLAKPRVMKEAKKRDPSMWEYPDIAFTQIRTRPTYYKEDSKTS
ncbi:Hypothetical protein POVR2_LOCUS272 [uncultured virus]|nr:Hypothetical protein POVR2_LOCUS272 [uncultured virus]